MIGNPKKLINWLYEQEHDKVFEITEIKDKRSLNANSYFWKLCTLLAEKLNTTKEEMYLIELKKYGQSLLIPVEPNVKPHSYFKYYEFYQKGQLNGKECDWYKIYKGSSDYDTKEMALLIDGIVQDCKEQDIPTLDDIKLEKMVEEWKV